LAKQKGIGFFHMLRDVLVASINKGQFPLAIAGCIVITMLIKMPPADVSKLAFRLLDGAEIRSYIGYVFALIFMIGWFFHSRYQRHIMTDEITRISEQRNRLQERLLGNRVESSDPR
jgi:hypothetical protein